MLIGFRCDLLLVRLGMHACSCFCSWDALQVCLPPMSVSACPFSTSLSVKVPTVHSAVHLIIVWRFIQPLGPGGSERFVRTSQISTRAFSPISCPHPFPFSRSSFPLNRICCASFPHSHRGSPRVGAPAVTSKWKGLLTV